MNRYKEIEHQRESDKPLSTVGSSRKLNYREEMVEPSLKIN